MVLKLYGNPQSTCTKRVALVLYEMKIPYELITIDLSKGEQKVPSFIEKQPFGQVPYLDDNGFIVFESRAICRYLAMKYKDQGPNLLPDFNDLESTALFEQAVSIEGSNFDAFAYPAVAEMVFKPRRGITPNPATFQSLVEQLDAKLKGYEYILGKQKYLGGNQLTVADLYHLPYGSMLAVAGSDVITREGRPNFTRWWNELTSRESWKAISGPQGVPVKNDF